MLLNEEKEFNSVDATKVINDCFKAWIDETKLSAAKDKYSANVKMHKGQLELLDDAAAGDELAVTYLYDSFLPLTFKAFWSKFIGKQTGYKLSLISNSEDVFGLDEKAWLLLSGDNDPNVYEKFNKDLFSEDSDLIKQFSYYYFRYFESECRKMYNAVDAASLSKETSYEDFTADGEQLSVSAPDHSDMSDLRLILQDFADWLKTEKEPKYTEYLKGISLGFKPFEIIKKMDITKYEYEKISAAVREWFLHRYPEVNKD